MILLIFLLLGVVGFLLLKDNDKTTRDTPVKFDINVPEIKRVSDTVYLTDTLYKDRFTVREEPINKLLIDRYTEAVDSIEKLNLYIKAITQREYTVEFTDSIQNVRVYSHVQGELLAQSINYHILPRKIKVDTTLAIPMKNKVKVFMLSEVGSSILELPDNPNIVGKASLILKNRRDNLFSFSVDTREMLWFGFGFKF